MLSRLITQRTLADIPRPQTPQGWPVYSSPAPSHHPFLFQRRGAMACVASNCHTAAPLKSKNQLFGLRGFVPNLRRVVGPAGHLWKPSSERPRASPHHFPRSSPHRATGWTLSVGRSMFVFGAELDSGPLPQYWLRSSLFYANTIPAVFDGTGS